MGETAGIRELRQNLSRYLERVKAGEDVLVTDRGRAVARLIPVASDEYAELAAASGATVPSERLEQIWERIGPSLEPMPAGTADALLAEARAERV